jgi:Cu2+-exporting ATPase
MTAGNNTLCRHCLLPTGRRPMQRTINGESCAFCCYGCYVAHQVKSGNREEWDAAWLLVRLGVGGFLSMNIMMFSLLLYTDAFSGADVEMLPVIHLLLWLFATPAVIILGEPFWRETWLHAKQGRLTASALIVLGVGAAYAYSVFATIEGGTHVYFDTASMVLMIFTIGYYLDAVGRAQAARDLQPLLAAGSEWATVVDGDTQQRRRVSEISPGTLVRVLPGQRIPVDGVIVEGESHTDEAVMTGENRQIAKSVGSPVIAGSINLDGPLLIQSLAAGDATRWSQICQSVHQALLRCSPTQRLADNIVGVFVPIILVLGAGTAIYWAQHLPFDRALLTGLAVLVVACPCAVGLAAPMATSVGIGRLARRGCLVRDPVALEALARTRVFAFDKTGTLTSGKACVVGIDSEGAETDEVLARAAGLGCSSEHWLARAIGDMAAARGLQPIVSRAVRTVPGRGICGRAEGQMAAAGSSVLMRDLGWFLPPALAEQGRLREASGRSVVYVGWAGRVYAVLTLDDTPLVEACATVGALRQRGLRVMLVTGDHAAAAQRIAAAVGIEKEDCHASLAPEAKPQVLDRHRQDGGPVAMVGDGLNDGPALARANVGIAVGSATDLARETAALVLPAGGLWLLPWVIDVAHAVRRTILTNLMWAFGYNCIAVTLAMLGLLQPVLAAIVMAGSSIVVVLNSLRLERLPEPAPPAAPNPPLALKSAPAAHASHVPVIPKPAISSG